MDVWDNTITTCEGCSRQIDMRELRYHQGIKKFVCPKCFKRSPSEDRSLIVEKDRIDYFCKYCKNNFSKVKGAVFTGECPFCGSVDLKEVGDKGPKLIRDI